MLNDGLITLGHARALLALVDDHRMLEFANEVVAKQLSVREVERRVREANEPATAPAPDVDQPRNRAPSPPAPSNQASPELRRIEDQLRRHFQTDVHLVVTGKEKGMLRIGFYSADDLERLLDLILGVKRSDFDDTARSNGTDFGDLDEIIFP
jgi:ParB family chromosome partitioning protein